MGEKVRYDGQHKRHNGIIEHLSNKVELIPICPEIGIGLGTPRPPIHRRIINGHPELVDTVDVSKNYTQKMNNYFESLKPVLSTLSGIILKSKSPSCGQNNVPLFDENGLLIEGQTTQGLFAELVQLHYPDVVVEDELKFNDQNFINIYLLSITKNNT